MILIGLRYDPFPFGAPLRFFGGLFSHAYLLEIEDHDAPSYTVYEMWSKGCRVVPWFEYHRGKEWMILRKSLGDSEARAVVAVARALVGVPYGYLSWPYLIKQVIIHWASVVRAVVFGQRVEPQDLKDWGWSVSLVCSEFVARCFKEAGVPLFGEETLVLPDAFFDLYLKGGLDLVETNMFLCNEREDAE